jgi:hypothetical protein
MTEDRPSVYQNALTKEEVKQREDAMYETLFNTMHVSKRGKHFPMMAVYSNGSARVEVPVRFVDALGLKEGKFRIAQTLIKDGAGLEAARRKGVLERTPMIVVTIVEVI